MTTHQIKLGLIAAAWGIAAMALGFGLVVAVAIGTRGWPV